MSRSAFGSSYYNWMNSLRSNYARSFALREKEEKEAADLTLQEMNKAERAHWYLKDNAKNHNTIKFDQIHDKVKPQPVLRRGQPFYLAIRFSRNVDLKKERVILNFRFGPKPSVSKDTLAVIVVEHEEFSRTKDDWDARIDPGTRGKDLVLQVFIPATAKVGIWRMDVRSGMKDPRVTETVVFEDETDVFVLFNPWCKEDLVYMSDEKKREEYIMNDKGKVFVGAYRSPRGRPWAFGQFDDVVLPVATYILELSHLCHTERGNPVKVVRAISAGVNDVDEEGILSGRWDGEYSDGTAPFKWTGSVGILEEYVRSGYKSVKYGQCWVFSALTTTICRALGIPSRSVTNFVSAHDTNSSLTIDKFFDKDGNEIDGGPDGENYDSIWNFHVWNDVWMARPDLPLGYGGWQAIDSTPQEESEHKMQCGPASLEAIRRGDIGLRYDCPFVFAEVNADIMHWGEDPESDWGYKRMKINNFHIGRLLLTKTPEVDDDESDEDKEDVINEYKNPEGSVGERLAIHNAIRACSRAQKYYEYKEVEEDVSFDLSELEVVKIGDSFKIEITIKNNSEEKRTIVCALSAKSVNYTGITHSLIKKSEGEFTLDAGKSETVGLTVTYKEYWKKLMEYCMIKMYSICRVKQTGQTWTDEDDFVIQKPKLKLEVSGSPKVDSPCEVIFSFENPLEEPLTECSVNVDGAGLMRPKTVPISENVPPKELFQHKFEFNPRIHGMRKIIASFNSKELFDINGTVTVNVAKS